MSILYRIVSQKIKLKPLHGYWVGQCPFDDHSESWGNSFVIERSQKQFYCYACGFGGDSISFVMKIRGLSWFEAVDLIRGIYLDPDPAA